MIRMTNNAGYEPEDEFILAPNLHEQPSDEKIGNLLSSYEDKTVRGWAVLNNQEVWMRIDPPNFHHPNPKIQNIMNKFANTLSQLNESLREYGNVPDDNNCCCDITPDIVRDVHQQESLALWIRRFSYSTCYLVFPPSENQ